MTIDIEEKLRNLGLIYSDYETTYKDISRSGSLDQIACGRGCSHCCKQLIFIYEIEGLYLRSYIDKLRFSNNLEEQKEGKRFKNSIEKWIEQFKSFIKAEAINIDLMISKCEVEEGKRWEWARTIWDAYKQHLQRSTMECPFLANNECSIYEDRPVICRSYWSLDVEICKSFFEMKDFKAQIESPPIQESIRTKFEKEIYNLSLSKRKIPLALVVANPEYYLSYQGMGALNEIEWKELQ